MGDAPTRKETLFARSAYDYFGEGYMRKYPDDLSKFKPLIDEFIAALPATAKVLDVGCGDGSYVAYLLERGLDPTGLDVSEIMLKRAEQKVPQERLLLMDMHSLDTLKSNSFDGIISICSLVYTSQSGMLEVLAEMKRLLKPGGYLLLMMLEGHGEGLEKEIYEDRHAAVYCSYYSADQLQEILHLAGFKTKKTSVTKLVVLSRQEITILASKT